MGGYICKNSLSCSLKICTFYLNGIENNNFKKPHKHILKPLFLPSFSPSSSAPQRKPVLPVFLVNPFKDILFRSRQIHTYVCA